MSQCECKIVRKFALKTEKLMHTLYPKGRANKNNSNRHHQPLQFYSPTSIQEFSLDTLESNWLGHIETSVLYSPCLYFTNNSKISKLYEIFKSQFQTHSNKNKLNACSKYVYLREHSHHG